MHTRTLRSLARLCSCVALASAATAGTRYVNASLTSGLNDGSSWANAHQGTGGLQAALALATSGDEIWVAQGTYLPSSSGVRTVSFQLKNGVAVLGGFAGNETSAAEAAPALNETVLSGDLQGDDPSNLFNDNSHHVLNGQGTNATAVCNGFTVRGGNANVGGANNDRGGGILCVGGSSPTLARCVFTQNRCTFGGGAGYINASSPSFTDCVFDGNIGGSFGGAFDMATSVGATFERCVFRNNTAARAGGIEIFGSSPVKVHNSLFHDNTSTGTGGGGAIFISGSSPQIRNCTIVFNTSTNNAAAGILAGSGTPLIANCVVFGNVGQGSTGSAAQLTPGTLNVTYSITPAGYPGVGNVFGTPLFENCGPFNYRLAPGSPGIDAGNNAAAPTTSSLDLLNKPRFLDDPLVPDTGAGTAPLVDMGAIEGDLDCNANGVPDFCDIQSGTSLDLNQDGLPDDCQCVGGAAYCSANPSSSGCVFSMSTSGLPSLTNPSGFVISTQNLEANQNGIQFFGTSGPNLVPFSNGSLCVAAPLYRLGIKNSLGAAPCSGSFSFDLQEVLNEPSGGPLVLAGQQVHQQTWLRDPASAFTTAVSDAVRYTVCP